MIDLEKLFESEACCSLALDNKEDREALSNAVQKYLLRGVLGMKNLSKEGRIGGDELDAALVLVEFVLRFGNAAGLPTLTRWAAAEYCTLGGIKHQRGLK